MESRSEEYNPNLSFKRQKLDDWKNNLETVRSENLNKLIFVHLNINTVRNKFDLLLNQIKYTADFLMISETRINCSVATVNRRL